MMKVRFVLANLIVAILMVLQPVGTWAAKPEKPPEGDTVLSADIKEADGTTGQDTNTGSGVKTGHIQDGAVSNSKLGADVEARIAALEAAVINLQSAVTSLQAENGAQQAEIADLQARLTAVEANSALQLDSFVSIDTGEINGVTGPHLIFEGVNVHVRSGFGTTWENWTSGYLTGLGNLIIGYNEEPSGLLPGERGGSHNLIMGRRNKFSSFAGIVHGESNEVNDRYSAVIAGDTNIVFGGYNAIIGGNTNYAEGSESVLIGGDHNQALGSYSVIVSGSYNKTLEPASNSSITGGEGNEAAGQHSSVSGGLYREAIDIYDWAAGSLWEDQ